MKLRVATYFLKRYDAGFDPESRDLPEGLSDSEKRSLLKDHPLLQVTGAYGERFRRPSGRFKVKLRKKIEKYLKSKL